MKGKITFTAISLSLALTPIIVATAYLQNYNSLIVEGSIPLILLVFCLNIAANLFQIICTIAEWLEEWAERNKKKTADELKHIYYEISEDIGLPYNQHSKETTTQTIIVPPKGSRGD